MVWASARALSMALVRGFASRYSSMNKGLLARRVDLLKRCQLGQLLVAGSWTDC